jgi:ribosomal protein L11 methyltransferase
MWPALDVRGGHELVLAAADQFAPTAAEERGEILRLFFATSAARDAAAAYLSEAYATAPTEVDDEDWARRSQHGLPAVRIGRIVVVSDANSPTSTTELNPAGPPIALTIQPSMGFGTGHHATTRLCLAALQAADPKGAFVLDVGTGSGILAIAAARLGAARALGLDNDPDAIGSAHANLPLNADVRNVEFAVMDLTAASLPQADLVVANLTGTLLVRTATALLAAVRPGGALIVSGILAHEEQPVRQAFSEATVEQRQEEEEWLSLTLRKPSNGFPRKSAPHMGSA